MNDTYIIFKDNGSYIDWEFLEDVTGEQVDKRIEELIFSNHEILVENCSLSGFIWEFFESLITETKYGRDTMREYLLDNHAIDTYKSDEDFEERIYERYACTGIPCPEHLDKRFNKVSKYTLQECKDYERSNNNDN
jgi:hypothetical protein